MKYQRSLSLVMLFSLLFGTALFGGDIHKPRVGILDFEARNVSEVEAEAVGEIFTSELVANGRFDIVDRKNLDSLLKEMDFQLSGWIDDLRI